MCKIIYDEQVHELPKVKWFVDVIRIRTNYEGRHIIADSNLLHGR